MLKNPQIRRFISASLFAGAFVWVAVDYFDVDPEVVWVLFQVSFVFVGVLIAVGLLGAPLVKLFNRQPTFLSKIEEMEQAELPGKLEEPSTNPKAE